MNETAAGGVGVDYLVNKPALRSDKGIGKASGISLGMRGNFFWILPVFTVDDLNRALAPITAISALGQRS